MNIHGSENEVLTASAGHDVLQIKTLNLYFDNIFKMPIYLKNAIESRLQKIGLGPHDLEIGAKLSKKELSDVTSIHSDPRLSTLEKVCAFLGVSVSGLLDNRGCSPSVNVHIGENSPVDIDISVQGDWIMGNSYAKDKDNDPPTMVFDIDQYLICPRCQYPGHPKVIKKGDKMLFVCPHCGTEMKKMPDTKE